MQTIQLSAQPRTVTGRAVRNLRNEDMLPAVMYGHDIPTENLSVPRRAFQVAYEKAGESTLVDLSIGEKSPVKVIINDVQREGITGKLLHIDFYQVNMKEKITAEVPLEFVGESVAVKQLGGVLVKNLTKVEVESLPADLPHALIVDISVIHTFEDKITLGDLKLPEGVTIAAEATEVVALVEAPRSEEELKALEGEVKQDVSTVEILTEKKEAVEGEPGATDAKAEDKK